MISPNLLYHRSAEIQAALIAWCDGRWIKKDARERNCIHWKRRMIRALGERIDFHSYCVLHAGLGHHDSSNVSESFDELLVPGA